jgi:hypothetical protein
LPHRSGQSTETDKEAQEETVTEEIERKTQAEKQRRRLKARTRIQIPGREHPWGAWLGGALWGYGLKGDTCRVHLLGWP